MTEPGPGAGSPTPTPHANTRGATSGWDSWLFVRLALLSLAVLATLISFWPPLTLVWWLLAAIGVATAVVGGGRLTWADPDGTTSPAAKGAPDAIDRIARGLGLTVCVIILLGVILNAVRVPLASTTWAVALGVLGAAIVVFTHVRRPRSDTSSSSQAQRSASADLVNGWRTMTSQPKQAAWVLLAAALTVTAVSLGAMTEPELTPELELSLSDPAAASTRATSVKVSVTSRERIENLVLNVQPATGDAPPAQRFAIDAGQTVERVVTLPATGASQILLTRPGTPALGRTLTINR